MSSRPTSAPGHRHDIQGLRAVAVLLVIADHAFGVPAGGFVGVDVFFVLSGFLMTSVLYREFDRTGRIRFLAFYRRRARRLLPAAAATVAVTVVGAWLLFPSGRFQATLWDAASALGFVSNWRFASIQTDYFQQGSATSPLQHFWSLSVEEQYYLVWPLALLMLCVLAASSSLRRPVVALLTSAATLLLFVLALTMTAADPGSAYFVTPARLWELSLGAAVALALPLTRRAAPRVRAALATAGLAGILAAAVVTPSGGGFPAPWAALAVVSTALVIAFPWEPVRFGRLHPLTNRVSGYLGDISYSLYLWHFPALVLLAEALRGLPGDGTPLPAALAVVLSGGLAALSYRFIEEPVRRSQWLEPRRERSETSVRRSTAVGVAALAVVACASVVFALVLDRGPAATAGGSGTAGAATPAPSRDAADTTGGPAAPASAGAATADLQAQLAQALAATSWPQLAQDPSDPVGVEVDRAFDRCSSGGFTPADCTWGAPDAPHTAVLVGDSIAAAYLPALAQVVGTGEWRLTSAALYACPFVDVRIGTSAKTADICATRKQTEVDLVRSLKPDVVIVSNTYLRGNDLDTGKRATLGAWRAGFDRQLAALDGSYGKLVVLPPPPYGANLAECYSPRTGPAECVTTVSRSDYRTSMAMLAEVAAAHSGSVLDNVAWFCVDGRCPAFAGDTLVKRDTWHPISTYVLRLVPAMREAFAGVLAD